MRHPFILTLGITISLAACATGPKRERPNLAIDSEATPPPAARVASTPTSEPATDEGAPKGEINLGLNGSGGELVVEGALTEEEQAALEASSEEETDDESGEPSDDDAGEDEPSDEESE